MKRTPLQRRAKRRQMREEEQAYVAWLHQEPCVVGQRHGFSLCEMPIEVAHLKHRGIGGKNVPWLANTYPLCRRHHAEQHALGVLSWQRKHGVDLEEEAERYAMLWRRQRLQGVHA